MSTTSNSNSPIDIPKLVKEYLAQFVKTYRVKKSEELDELEEWCKNNCGIEYKDWFLFRGGKYDKFASLHIKSERTATLFILVWGHMIWEA